MYDNNTIFATRTSEENNYNNPDMTRDQIQDPLFPDCPVRNILARICSKWSLLILHSLETSGVPTRYRDLQKNIPDISQKMLSTTLRELEADGFIIRTAYPEVPPRVEYQLTERAISFLPHMKSIVGWAMDNFAPIVNKRTAYYATQYHQPEEEKKK